MPLRLVWREAPDAPLATADVPHLAPIQRAVEAGRDGSVRLPDGRRIKPSHLVSIAQIDDQGRPVRAWDVRAHGLDGGHDWREAWRDVANVTHGVTPEDVRWRSVIEAVEALDESYRRRDALAWTAARRRLDRALAGIGAEVA